MNTITAYKHQRTGETFDTPEACLRSECWWYRDQAVRILMDTHLFDNEEYLQRRLHSLWSSLKGLRDAGREYHALQQQSAPTPDEARDIASNVIPLKKAA